MPVDPTILSNVSLTDTISAEDLRARFSELERFVNGGITTADFRPDKTDIFSSQHIVKPRFYSVGNNRVEGSIADVYYRNTAFSAYNRHIRHESSGSYQASSFDETELKALPFSAWQPIDGMAASVFVKGNESVTAYVNGSLYAHALGSDDTFSIPLKTISKNLVGSKYKDTKTTDSQRAAFVRATSSGTYIGAMVLYVDRMDGSGPIPIERTRRRIFNRGENAYRFRNQQISFCSKINLNPGINKVSYRMIYRLRKIDDKRHKHLVVDSRNFFVDVHYK